MTISNPLLIGHNVVYKYIKIKYKLSYFSLNNTPKHPKQKHKIISPSA